MNGIALSTGSSNAFVCKTQLSTPAPSMAELRERGLADRTIFNRISALATFLRSFGIDGLLSRRDLPRYTEKFVDAYNEVEIAQLIQAGDKRSRTVFGFFLGTGCREQEVAHMTWSDVDLDQKIVRITAKPIGVGDQRIVKSAACRFQPGLSMH